MKDQNTTNSSSSTLVDTLTQAVETITSTMTSVIIYQVCKIKGVLDIYHDDITIDELAKALAERGIAITSEDYDRVMEIIESACQKV